MDFENLKVDRMQFTVARLEDQDDSPAYWLTRPVEERIAALELLRHSLYEYSEVGETIQRVLEVAKLDGR